MRALLRLRREAGEAKRPRPTPTGAGEAISFFIRGGRLPWKTPGQVLPESALSTAKGSLAMTPVYSFFNTRLVDCSGYDRLGVESKKFLSASVFEET